MIRLTEQQGAWLVQLCQQAPPGMLPDQIHDIGRIAAEQIAHPAHPQDLLDTVAEVLQGAGSGSGLGANAVGALQRALLSPVELARFKANVNASQSCHECRRTFVAGEIATMSGKRIFCSRCCPPDFVVCSECNDAVEVSGVRKTLERALAKHQCRGRAEESPPPSTDVLWMAAGGGTAEPARTRTITTRNRIEEVVRERQSRYVASQITFTPATPLGTTSIIAASNPFVNDSIAVDIETPTSGLSFAAYEDMMDTAEDPD